MSTTPSGATVTQINVQPAGIGRSPLTPVEGAPTTRMIQCTECEARSPLGPPLADFAHWALGHVRASGHRGFQQVTTELLHAGPGGAGVL